MESNKLSFLSFLSYVVHTILIVFSTSFFLFAVSSNNILSSLLIAFPYALILTIYIIIIIYLNNKSFKSVLSLIIFLTSYLFAGLLIFLSLIFDTNFWFFAQLITVSLFTLFWLILRLLHDIKTKNNNDVIHLSSYFVPFIVMVSYVALIVLNIPTKPINNELQTRGVNIYNKIVDKVNQEVTLEGNQLFKVVYIAYEEENLKVGYLTEHSNIYNQFIFNYDGLLTANEVFENIETTNNFPSYVKSAFIFDENTAFVDPLPLDATTLSDEIVELNNFNYQFNETIYSDNFIKAKYDNEYHYITFSCLNSESRNAPIYIYEGIGEYVVKNVEKATN